VKTQISEVKWEDMDSKCCEGEFPYGTSLKFSDDIAESVDIKGLKAGQFVEVKAMAFVSEKSEESRDGESVEKELKLQLVEIELKKAPKNYVERMYS